jgi:hypothetical protein
MHFDMKTGKWQNNMLPSEMLQAQGKRDRDAGHELRRENSMPEPHPHASPEQNHFGYGNAGTPHPQINVTDHHGRPAAPAFTMSSPTLPQGFAELDSETPGRYRPHGGDEKASYGPQRSGRRRRGHSSSSTTRYYDDDDMADPPPAYRE